jgi:hypothetical protein
METLSPGRYIENSIIGYLKIDVICQIRNGDIPSSAVPREGLIIRLRK